MSDHLGVAWRDYRTKVMPLTAPQIQAQECRRAFYAGARAFLSIQLGQLTTGDDATEADFRMMDDLHAELEAFKQAVVDGRA